jgi:hypothetical protein
MKTTSGLIGATINRKIKCEYGRTVAPIKLTYMRAKDGTHVVIRPDGQTNYFRDVNEARSLWTELRGKRGLCRQINVI